MTAPLHDAHNHLHDARLAPHRDAILAALGRLDLGTAVVNGTCEADWADVARLAGDHAWILPSFGLHPWRARDRSPGWREALAARLEAAGPRVAIGEIGLDKWIRDHDIDDQREVFTWQLRLAAERNLPASIHCLQAWGLLADVLRREPVPDRGFLLHAYGGPAEMVGPLAKRGAFFSFNGHFLLERKQARREVFRALPIERILVETDAPDMAPPPEYAPHALAAEPDGAVLNHPANLGAIYQALARLRGLPPEELAARVDENFRRLFG